jgi:hypothetical protein
VGPDGNALLEPRGDGSRRVSAIVLIETFTAQRLDTWRRLKICRNDRCAVSFYDRSRNNSAVWHDSRVCGNAIYLRASRARKRQGAQHQTTRKLNLLGWGGWLLTVVTDRVGMLRGTICPHELRDGGTDLLGTVLLDERTPLTVVSVKLGSG